MASSLGEGGIGGTTSVAIFLFFFSMKTEKSVKQEEKKWNKRKKQPRNSCN